ncbi:hypothetical protein [Kribbella ginsengisoli]|uniref:Uncharacterized protein n=1 Tax=Kribbella ginsengisoli TaxID=363865 RepID=A0ABP6VWT4_9ACTN
MTADDEIEVDTAAGPMTVSRRSPTAQALAAGRLAAVQHEQVGRGLMDWSLGSELADLLWMTVPVARSALAALAGRELADAAEYGRFLNGPLYGDVASLVHADVLLPALAEGRREVVVATLAVLHRVIAGSDGDFRWETIDGYVIRMLEKEGHGEVLQEIDPALMELVRETRRRLGQD